MSSHVPHLPPEIVLVILSTDKIDFTTVLRLTRVDKEWRSLIYDTNALRASCFFHNACRPENTPWIPAYMVLDYIPGALTDSSTPMTLLSDLEFELHPLLLPYKVKGQFTSAAFLLSYRLVRALHNFREERSTSWSHMCITSPPMRRLATTVHHIRCDSRNTSAAVQLAIENPTGITCGDLFEELWNTNLKRNLGLIDDDKDCKGISYPYTGDSEKCLCYDALGPQDRAWLKVEPLRKNLEARGIVLQPLGYNYTADRSLEDFPAQKEISTTDMQEFALMCVVEELASIEMDRESIRGCERQLSRHKYNNIFEYASTP